MTKIGWLEHAKSNLLRLSEDENIFIKAKKKWIYGGHKEIKYEISLGNYLDRENKLRL